MARALAITGAVLGAIGLMFYVLITNSTRPTHMHFSNDGGLLKNVVYYSANPPETASGH